jgi:plastocyanin
LTKVLAAAGFVVAATACGSDGASGPPTAPPGAGLVVEALDLKFDRTEYTIPAGDTLVAYLGIDRKAPHTLVIRDGQDRTYGDRLRVTGGEVDTGTVTLEPGVYELVCDVPGHYAAGMRADLVVTG